LPKAPLVPSDELRLMQGIEVEVLGGLPTTHKRNLYVLVVSDYDCVVRLYYVLLRHNRR